MRRSTVSPFGLAGQGGIRALATVYCGLLVN